MDATDGKPKQADLRRAISTAYYALFHCLATCCADSLVGGPGSKRHKEAWRRTFRSLEHGHAKAQCMNRNPLRVFAPAIQSFAVVFASMQEKRHLCDYDPHHKVYKSAVKTDVGAAKAAIAAFIKTPVKDRKAFAAWVMLKPKGN